MELPCRSCGDIFLPPGELLDIRRRLRHLAPKHDLTTVAACAFDHRTRMLPFVVADTRMAPAGVRAIGSAMVDAGFEKTRIVLQQWNPKFRPSKARLDGRIPDLLLLSSMEMHIAELHRMLRDVAAMPAEVRPLVIAGGPLCIYAPWKAFSDDPAEPWGADVTVTGEEYVLLNLLETLLSVRLPGEPLRASFIRARNSGLLDDIPGLVYPVTDDRGAAVELVDTGIQRMAQELDDLPHPVHGYRLLERPSGSEGLAPYPIDPRRLKLRAPIVSLVMTTGCKFNCPYCPIPAYNQRQLRFKSGDRIRDEIVRLRSTYGFRFFFGSDDNFFNDKDRALGIAESLAAAQFKGRSLRHGLRIGTEATIHDTIKMGDDLKTIRKGGFRSIWLGVEDMSGNLVKKGQTADSTAEAFRLLRSRGISPMPMMMHHDDQPLRSKDDDSGLLNQIKLLKKAGAVSLQVLMITPSAGSKRYVGDFESGLMFDRVADTNITPRHIDGNYVVATRDEQPWKRQLNLMLGYLSFYNPGRLFKQLIFGSSRFGPIEGLFQAYGMYGLTMTLRRTLPWLMKLYRGPIVRSTRPPHSQLPMRSPDNAPAAHALPGTPGPKPPPSDERRRQEAPTV